MFCDSSSPSTYQFQSSQHYSPVHPFNVDEVEDMNPFFGSQRYSSAQASGGPSEPVQDDSPIEEVLSQEKDSQQEALEKFKWKVVRDHEIKVLGEVNVELEPDKKLNQENESPDDFYGLMYDTDDDASISGKSCEHFGWDWDSHGMNDWQDIPYLKLKTSLMGLGTKKFSLWLPKTCSERFPEDVFEMD
ncbi:hypothetical protein Tco_0251622 [Tanacetum coccineum]